jgi:hypothetical protein
LIDTDGKKREVKFDRLAGTTGNVFFEYQTLNRSGADLLLIFAAGLTFILSKVEALELLNHSASCKAETTRPGLEQSAPV